MRELDTKEVVVVGMAVVTVIMVMIILGAATIIRAMG